MDLLWNLITAYLGYVPNLDFSILGLLKVKVLCRVCKFTVAEGELRKPTVADGSSVFLCSGSRQIFFFFFFTMFMSHHDHMSTTLCLQLIKVTLSLFFRFLWQWADVDSDADSVFRFKRTIYYFLGFPSRAVGLCPLLPCDFNESLGGRMLVFRLSYEFQIVYCLQLLSCFLGWCIVVPFPKRYATW